MKITIIGAGTIGKIFLVACQKVFSESQITATAGSGESIEELRRNFPNINFSSDNKLAVENSDLVIFAVKPQNFLEVAKEIKGLLNPDVLVMSVMAGVNIEKIKNELVVNKIIRTMPNLGARVEKSMTVWTCSDELNESDKKSIIVLLNSIGKELYVETEEKIDKATAVSGSGPGFFFALVEEWLKAVEEFGFSEEESKLLLLQTIDGANDLLQCGEALKLREQVTSKGGTTETGLRVLHGAKLKELWKEVLESTFDKAVEISNI